MSYYGDKLSDIPGLDEARYKIRQAADDADDLAGRIKSLLAGSGVSADAFGLLSDAAVAYHDAADILTEAIYKSRKRTEHGSI